MSMHRGFVRQWFVQHIYATHNGSRSVRRALGRCLGRLKDGDVGLNVGCGDTRLHPALINLDKVPGPQVDCCAPAEAMPFPDGHFAIIITQETLEHVQDPWAAVREMFRTMRPGGTLYLQVPFVIGYHPGPTDFWRFSKEGIRELVAGPGFVCEEVGQAVGPATGFYRILIEFLATSFAAVLPWGYHVMKGGFALLCYPIKWFDPLLMLGRQSDRIAGGYYVIARKPGETAPCCASS
jgi:SAM-dependent methyltransferase